MAGHRGERVGDLIKEEVATLITMGELKDPRIGLVTITSVKMSGDLKHARIFFSLVGPAEERAETLKGLESAKGFIRRHLAKRLRMKQIPAVAFEYDDSVEHSIRISEVLRGIGHPDKTEDERSE
jgi:ribosome-binding factor A